MQRVARQDARKTGPLSPEDALLIEAARRHRKYIVWNPETIERARRLGIAVPQRGYRNPRRPAPRAACSS